MRLIDADALWDKAYEVWGFEADAGDTSILMDMITDAPTIDPVKHEFEWTYVKDKHPECDWGAETAPVLFIFGSTVFSGYYGRGGKLRDSYFRQYNDVHEGVDSKDVIAWAWASSLNPPKKE